MSAFAGRSSTRAFPRRGWKRPSWAVQDAAVGARTIHQLRTPALLVDAPAFQHNLSTMAAALPGARLRPHVKAHKSTALARRQMEAGHPSFACATVREVEGMAG